MSDELAKHVERMKQQLQDHVQMENEAKQRKGSDWMKAFPLPEGSATVTGDDARCVTGSLNAVSQENPGRRLYPVHAEEMTDFHTRADRQREFEQRHAAMDYALRSLKDVTFDDDALIVRAERIFQWLTGRVVPPHDPGIAVSGVIYGEGFHASHGGPVSGAMVQRGISENVLYGKRDEQRGFR